MLQELENNNVDILYNKNYPGHGKKGGSFEA
jgi:hypothetical protein